jgi:hypothetical protein
MAVPRLRSLGLVRVHSLGLRYSGAEMPDALLQDLTKASLFCGNYIFDEEVEKRGGPHDGPNGRTFHKQLALTIKYDGDIWTFMYRSRSDELECCQNCAYSRPELVTVKIKVRAAQIFVLLL